MKNGGNQPFNFPEVPVDRRRKPRYFIDAWKSR